MSWADTSVDMIWDVRELEKCRNHLESRLIPHFACTKSCSWDSGPQCLNCINLGAWIACPCLWKDASLTEEDRILAWKLRIKHDNNIRKRTWLIVHPTANLQRERNYFQASQLWKVIKVSDTLTLIGSFYSAGITVEKPVKESA